MFLLRVSPALGLSYLRGREFRGTRTRFLGLLSNIDDVKGQLRMLRLGGGLFLDEMNVEESVKETVRTARGWTLVLHYDLQNQAEQAVGN